MLDGGRALCQRLEDRPLVGAERTARHPGKPTRPVRPSGSGSEDRHHERDDEEPPDGEAEHHDQRVPDRTRQPLHSQLDFASGST